jgi:hypothetical protein
VNPSCELFQFYGNISGFFLFKLLPRLNQMNLYQKNVQFDLHHTSRLDFSKKIDWITIFDLIQFDSPEFRVEKKFMDESYSMCILFTIWCSFLYLSLLQQVHGASLASDRWSSTSGATYICTAGSHVCCGPQRVCGYVAPADWGTSVWCTWRLMYVEPNFEVSRQPETVPVRDHYH